MSTKGLSSATLPPVTDAEERQIRAEFDHVITAVGSSTPRSLHVGLGGGEKLCDHEHLREPTEKPIDVFPLGYRPICRECGAVWRRSR